MKGWSRKFLGRSILSNSDPGNVLPCFISWSLISLSPSLGGKWQNEQL